MNVTKPPKGSRQKGADASRQERSSGADVNVSRSLCETGDEATCFGNFMDYALTDAMLDNSLAMMFIKGRDRRYLSVNKAYASLFGKDRQDLVGLTARDLLPPDALASNEAEDDEIFATGRPSYRMQAYPNEGMLRHFETAKLPLLNTDGEVGAICFFGVEVTDRQRAFQELQEQTTRLQGILNNTQSIVHIVDRDGRFILANKRTASLWHTSEELIAGTTYYDHFDSETACWLESVNRQVMADGSVWEGELELSTPDGRLNFAVHKFPVFSADGSITSVGTVAHDITTLKHAEIILKQHVEEVERQVEARTAELRQEVVERKATEEALKDSLTRFQTLFELAPDAVYLQSGEGVILDCNVAAEAVFGFAREEMVGMPARNLWNVGDDEAHGWLCGGCGVQGDGCETDAVRKNGEVFPVEVQCRGIAISGADVLMVVVRDISERKQAEQQLKLFQRVFEGALEGITITDASGSIVAVNEAFTHITGYTAEEAVGQNPRILKSDRHPAAFYEDMWRQLTTSGTWEGEIWNRRKGGEAYPEWLAISAIRDGQGSIRHYVAVFHDISEMKEKERQIHFQAYHDALTGLPNRALLKDRISMSISHADRFGSMVAILFIDLDNFKNINDSLGHAVGDDFLKLVGKELRGLLRAQDTISRLGGDEFVIMLEDVTDEAAVVHLAERIAKHFEQSLTVAGYDLFVTMSIGVALYPHDGSDPDGLIQSADLAMYQAKEQGKNRIRLYTPYLNERVQRRLQLESDIRKGLQEGAFLVHYQPKVDIRSGSYTGMEALLRWEHPEGLLLSPGDFLGVAEETGLVVQMGELVMEEACKMTQRLVKAGIAPLRCSVNLSPQQFQQPNLLRRIDEILRDTGLDPRLLELEITETTLIKDIPQTSNKLRQLAEKGISISVDDFGSGYSSLYYLKYFPINTLKIDRSFITGLPDESNDAAIVATIIAMAEHMNLRVIAEGVENEAQLAFLLLQGCDEIQGYLFGKPMPEDEFIKHITKPPRL
ncbi:EAL domain-containing protein [Desulfovibrio mangrovi]|uniref:EAL domain-containing protein n=1 Tax=Desulfovibrio mangrovi TaxID=2976983 RepID=UPI002247ABB3|nr:EAL domain-containing protein [Desulfovibrio mangrovi]UZP66840.1 EAL domain-containing protein [Desulfovibrio mangrovi]